MNYVKLITLLSIFLVLGGCDRLLPKDDHLQPTMKEDKIEENQQLYIDPLFNFKVVFPKDWFFEPKEMKIKIGTDLKKVSGLQIRINNDPNQTLFIFGHFGEMTYEEKKFTKLDVKGVNVSGYFYKHEVLGRIHGQLITTSVFEKGISGYLDCSYEVYNDNYLILLKIFRSLEFK